MTRGVRGNGDPFGSDLLVKKPKALSWAGHKTALGLGREAYKAGKGKRGYLGAVGLVLRIEQVTAAAVAAKAAAKPVAKPAASAPKAPAKPVAVAKAKALPRRGR